ncbi:MAG: hypothetical protein JOZ69_04225, partial [Myxococcales bacterium]|nr:hypothetical protein [Myxococcales bacterium]
MKPPARPDAPDARGPRRPGRPRPRPSSGGSLVAFASALVWALGSLAPARASAAGALEAVVQDATHEIGQGQRSTLVVAAPLSTDVPAPKGEELALRLASLVAGRMGAAARPHGQTAPLPAARALAGGASALAYVQPEIAKGELRISVDV